MCVCVLVCYTCAGYYSLAYLRHVSLWYKISFDVGNGIGLMCSWLQAPPTQALLWFNEICIGRTLCVCVCVCVSAQVHAIHV